MPSLEQTYRYPQASALVSAPQGCKLALASEIDADAQRPAEYLVARALHPQVTAKGLRAVSEIVGSRFYVPPAMLARILREADPVATVSPGAVRFEGFSACCSAYARMDLDNCALQISRRRNGTTNVDFGPELRGALASVGKDTRLDLTIGSEAVRVTRDDRTIVEKKVPLPVRWVKGFGEVQVVLAEMERAFAMSRVAAQRFLRSLPRGKSDHLQWVSLAGSQTRLSSRETKGAVPLRGAHRLKVLDTLAALSDRLEVYISPRTGATAWVLGFGVQRFWLVLNAEPWRGFSGDGGLLAKIATAEKGATAAVRAQLNWQDGIEPAELAAATGLSPADVDTALAELASLGLVGFDPHLGSYFHRVLPFDFDRVAQMNPRLVAAEKLAAAGAVTMTPTGAEVASDGVVHRVTLDGSRWSCTCPWFAKNGAERGPCKHVLAAELVKETKG